MRSIPYGKQTINKQDIQSVVNTLKSNWITQGPTIKKFETGLARYCGAKYAVAVSSGTAALHCAYLVAGLSAGDEIITTPNTFAATATMAIACDAKPIFCDIRLDTYNIDEQKIEKLITKKTKIIVPVHFAGHPAEMDEIIKIAKKHKLVVIEDACHGLSAIYKNKKIGSLNSVMTIFSFHPVKPITTGEGGAILTNNKNCYTTLLRLRSHGIEKNSSGFNVMKLLGFNYRITDMQSALGISQLKKLDRFTAQRRRIVAWYEKNLSDIKEIILPKELPNIRSSWHLYVIRLTQHKLRNQLMKYLQNRGIGATLHYPPVYSHPYYRANGYATISLPQTENYARSCLTLPCYPLLKREEVHIICTTIKSFFKNAA